jgi:kinesin family protein 11
MFEDLIKHVNSQKSEVEELRRQLTVASETAIQANAFASSKLDTVLSEERQQAASDRQNLLSQIANLITSQGETQDARLTAKVAEVQKDILSSKEVFEESRSKYSQGMDNWNDKETSLVGDIVKSRETLKSKLKEDWVAANKHNASLQTSTKSVHEETVRIVDEQMKDISIQMQALDDFVTRARSQNAHHHDTHAQSLQGLSTTVRGSYSNIGTHFTSTYERVKDLGDEMFAKTGTLREALSPLDSTLRQPLAELRANIASTMLTEYAPTGETPQKMQYQYPTELPRTEAHDHLIAALNRPVFTSPTKTSVPVIFNDAPEEVDIPPRSVSLLHSVSGVMPTGLREIDANIPSVGSLSSAQSAVNSSANSSAEKSIFKKSVGSGNSGTKLSMKVIKKSTVVALEGRENAVPCVGGVQASFSQSTGRRRSPRTG